MSRPIVLLYHAVAPLPPDAGGEERHLFVHPAAFEQQMDLLARQGFKTVRLDGYAEAIDRPNTDPRSVLLTFDDGYAHVDETVTPVLRRHGFTAVMFACWSHLGGWNTWDATHPNLARLAIATPQQLERMAAGPWEIASHALQHVDLRGLPQAQRVAELVEARERLSQLVHASVVDLAYPFGYDDPEVRRDARRAGYRMGFVAGQGVHSDPWRQSRRPIDGADTIATFRLKTATWSDALYRVRGVTPAWAWSAAQGLLKARP